MLIIVSYLLTQPSRDCHDSTIFKGSLIGRKFINGVFGNGFLLGDSGYACATYLLTPFSNPSSPKEVVKIGCGHFLVFFKVIFIQYSIQYIQQSYEKHS
jgi:hypothetical protein